MWKCNNCGDEVKILEEKFTENRIQKTGKKSILLFNYSRFFFRCNCSKTSKINEKIENIATWED